MMALDPPIQRGGWESQDWPSKQQCRNLVVGEVLSDTPPWLGKRVATLNHVAQA